MDTIPKVVITGLGIISSNSSPGKESFGEAIFRGISGIKPIALFDTSEFKAKAAGEVNPFVPEDILGKAGLRTQDRSTKMLSCAVRLSLDDAKLAINEENARNIGIAVGNTLGSLQSICDFDRVALKEGPQYVNPSLFPNTVINAQASQSAIRFNIKGFNATISTGFTAGLDAVSYASNLIRLGRKKMVLAGGVEELSLQTFIGFYRAGCLAGLKDSSLELSCPFDKRRNGIVLGEGSAIVVLEELSFALKRKAHIYAELKGFGACIDSNAQGIERAMRLALERACMEAREIDFICAGANSGVQSDSFEAAAIKKVFGSRPVRVSALKSMLGECYSASGALQLVAAALSVEKGKIPPTINYCQKDPLCDLSVVASEAQSGKVNNVLINAFGPDGCNSSLIISRFS